MQRGILALVMTAMLIAASVAIDSIPQADGINIGATATTVPGSNDSFEQAERRRARNTHPPTTRPTPPNPSTTIPATTTTNTAKSTTVPPKPDDDGGSSVPAPGGADQCIANQIAAEVFKTSGNNIKTRFDIMVNLQGDVQAGTNLWTAPYKVDLGNNWGWISGDRAGYKGAYMFLVNRDTGQVVARVLFRNLSDSASYIQINDMFMSEINETGIGYDGTCADGSASDPVSQAQTPAIKEQYAVDNGPEVRPVIPILVNGVQVEDRSYTNTVTPGTDLFRFTDLGRITTPFTDFNGVGGAAHTVYERQIVGGRVDLGDGFQLAVVVYYDILDPSATIG